MEKKLVFAILALILVLGLMSRLNPFLIGSMGGPDPYFHARMSQQFIEEKGMPEFDPLSQQGRHYSYAPLFHAMYAGFSLATGLPVKTLVNLLPAVYGIAGIFIAFLFARKLFNTKIALFSAFALSIMVLHILRTASYSRPDGLSMLLVPAIIYLLYTKRYKTSLLLVSAQILLHPLSTAYLLVLMIFWFFIQKIYGRNAGSENNESYKERIEKFVSGKKLFLFILLPFLIWIAWLFSLPYPITDYVSGTSFESSETSRLTFLNIFTYFTFSWIFFLIGLFKVKNNVFLKFWFLFSLFVGFFAMRLGLFITMPAAILAGFGFNFVLEKVRPYTKFFFILIVCLVVFAAGPTLINQNPFISHAEEDSMVWLKNYSSSDENIMVQWSNGHPAAYYTERKIIVDGYFEFAPDLEARNENSKALIQTSNCDTINEEIKKFNANYFLLLSQEVNADPYKYGILEADCKGISLIYANDESRIIEYRGK